jgi:hypothetical protein
MDIKHKRIIRRITEYLDKYPDQRFGQALFNLNINEFESIPTGSGQSGKLRDIYNDSDLQILQRMNKEL